MGAGRGVDAASDAAFPLQPVCLCLLVPPPPAKEALAEARAKLDRNCVSWATPFPARTCVTPPSTTRCFVSRRCRPTFSAGSRRAIAAKAARFSTPWRATTRAGDFRRDEALQQFLHKQTSLAFLVERFRALLEQGDQGELEISPFDRILAEMPAREQGEGAYFVARFLEARARQGRGRLPSALCRERRGGARHSNAGQRGSAITPRRCPADASEDW